MGQAVPESGADALGIPTPEGVGLFVVLRRHGWIPPLAVADPLLQFLEILNGLFDRVTLEAVHGVVLNLG